jgi:hypothetical protein
VVAELIVFRATIKWRGVRAAMRLAVQLAKAPRLRRRPASDPAETVAHVQAVAGGMPFRADCLPQALTSWVELQRRGFTPTVRLGVSLDGDPSAHAWIELDGVALCDESTHRYHTFAIDAELPPAIVGAA